MVGHHFLPNPSRVVIDDPIFVLKAFNIINLLVKNNIPLHSTHGGSCKMLSNKCKALFEPNSNTRQLMLGYKL